MIVCLFAVNQGLNSAFWTTPGDEGLGEGGGARRTELGPHWEMSSGERGCGKPATGVRSRHLPGCTIAFS